MRRDHGTPRSARRAGRGLRPDRGARAPAGLRRLAGGPLAPDIPSHGPLLPSRAMSQQPPDGRPEDVFAPGVDRAGYVQTMFGDIAGRYDLVNSLMTLGRHQ